MDHNGSSSSFYMDTDVPSLNKLFRQVEQEEIDALKRNHRGRRLRHVSGYDYDDSGKSDQN